MTFPCRPTGRGFMRLAIALLLVICTCLAARAQQPAALPAEAATLFQNHVLAYRTMLNMLGGLRTAAQVTDYQLVLEQQLPAIRNNYEQMRRIAPAVASASAAIRPGAPGADEVAKIARFAASMNTEVIPAVRREMARVAAMYPDIQTTFGQLPHFDNQ